MIRAVSAFQRRNGCQKPRNGWSGWAEISTGLRGPLPAVATRLEETLGDTLALYALQEAEARRRLRTTNALEREHEEVRRRTRVIRIFPNEASYLRLATALAADRSDQWAKRRYIIPTSPRARVTPDPTKGPDDRRMEGL
jgi:transposase-like protein